MENVDIRIIVKELLLTNDRVVLPGMGAFVTKYQEATIVPGKNEFIPPKKLLFFNPIITYQADTLIAEQLKKSKGISLQEAHKEVLLYVEEIQETLAKGRDYDFSPLGYFQAKPQGFEFVLDLEDNLLLESFGFNEFTFNPREGKVPPKLESELNPVKQKRSKRGIILALIFIPLLITGGVYLLVNQGIVDLGGFMSGKIGSDNLMDANKDNSEIGKVLDEATQAENALKPDKEAASKYEDFSRFSIIAGSFSEFKNAEKLRQELEMKGYSPEIVLSESNYYRIYLKTFNDREDALRELRKEQGRNNDINIWLLSEK